MRAGKTDTLFNVELTAFWGKTAVCGQKVCLFQSPSAFLPLVWGLVGPTMTSIRPVCLFVGAQAVN